MRPLDTEAARHPLACEYCGKYRGFEPSIEREILTDGGHILKACEDCFAKTDNATKRLVKK